MVQTVVILHSWHAHMLCFVRNAKGMLLPHFQIGIIRGFLGKCKERRISSRGRRCSNEGIPQCVADHWFPFYACSTPCMCTSSALNPRKRKDSQYMCSDCDVWLCVIPYSKQFHTQKKVWKDKDRECGVSTATCYCFWHWMSPGGQFSKVNTFCHKNLV